MYVYVEACFHSRKGEIQTYRVKIQERVEADIEAGVEDKDESQSTISRGDTAVSIVNCKAGCQCGECAKHAGSREEEHLASTNSADPKGCYQGCDVIDDCEDAVD
jgi:hypothetical protein